MSLAFIKRTSKYSITLFMIGVGTVLSQGSLGQGTINEQGVALDLVDAPLDQGIQPPPNILLINDDSLSMDWEIVVGQGASQMKESLETFNYNGNLVKYAYLYGGNNGGFNYDNETTITEGQYYGMVAPPHGLAPQLNTAYFSSAMINKIATFWRLRTHHYNLIYYNPAVRYDPWPGMPASNPSNAKVDPSKNLTVNLTSTSSQNLTVHVPTSYAANNNFNTSTYIPVYYTWNKAGNNDDLVDTNECHRMIEIKTNAKEKTCDGTEVGGPIFPIAKDPARTDCSAPNHCSAAEELQNFANWFTYYRRREFVAKAALMSVAENFSEFNVGYASLNAGDAKYNGANTLLPISPSNNTSQLLNVIQNTRSVGSTPLINALDKAGRYYACESSGHIFANGTQCPSYNNTLAACQQNYSIVMTDGFWRTDTNDWPASGNPTTTNPAMADNDSSNSPFAGGAFADQSGSGNPWLTMADVSMYYFMNDLLPSVEDKVSPNNIELSRMVDPTYWDSRTSMHQHVNTFTIGFGVFNDSANPIGTMREDGLWQPPEPTDNINWPRFTSQEVESDKLEDLKHAAFNGRGLYYSANNVSALTDNLINILSSIKLGAGAVGAVSFNTQRLSTDSMVYTATYQSRYNAGNVLAYAIDSATGQVSSTPTWQASTQISNAITQDCTSPSDSRTILSFDRNGPNSTGVIANASNSGAAPFLGQLSGQELDWIHGQKQNETDSVCSHTISYRARPAGNGILGDIIHSRPLYVGPPASNQEGGAFPSGTNLYSSFVSTHSSRTPLVMVGANDGMLHGFNGTSGNEIFAYLPHRLIQGGNGNNSVKDLTDPYYGHQYYVDLSPAVQDVFIKQSPSSIRDWRTVVIGGYRTGGKGYFAIDVTDPSSFSGASQGTGNVLWEFSDLDYPGMGVSYSVPLLAMTNETHPQPNNGNIWRAILGNGYNSTDGVARLILLDIEKGTDGWNPQDFSVISVGATPSASETKNGLSPPVGIDDDQNGSVDYVYAGDLKGDVYRFDLTSSNGNFTATKIFTAADENGRSQAITARPYVVRHPTIAGSYIVVVATGSWLTQDDSNTSEIHSIYGIVDSPSTNLTSAYTRSELTPRYLKNVTEGTTVKRVIQGAELNWSTSAGWYFDFNARAADLDPTDPSYATASVVNPGERAIRNMIARGGYIFVNTIFPTAAQTCDTIAGGSVMSFNPTSGLLDRVMFDFNQDGAFDEINGDPVAGEVTNTSLSDSAMLEAHLVYQETDSNGVVTVKSILTNTNQAMRTGRLSWTQVH